MRETQIASARFWRHFFKRSLYFSGSVLLFHDLFIIISHTVNPRFLEWANPFLLEKLLSALVAMIAV